MDKQRLEPPAPIELAPDVPEDLNALCVDLLRRRPEDRPSGSRGPSPAGEPRARPPTEVRVRNPGAQSAADVGIEGSVPAGRPRASSDRARDGAFADMRLGRTVVVYLHGPSGAGKTALLQNFLDEHLERGDAVILAGRCYERESVPYKALDSLIDALGRHLGRLPAAEVAALLPRDVGSLARVFPSLRRVQAVAQSPRPRIRKPRPPGAAPPGVLGLARAAGPARRPEAADPRDRRPAVGRCRQRGPPGRAAPAARRPGVPLPGDLSQRGSPRPARSSRRSSTLRAGRDHQERRGGSGLDCRELDVEPLEPDEARDLARSLLGAERPGRSATT